MGPAGDRAQLQARPASGAAGLGVALVLAAGLLDAEPLYVPGVTLLLVVAGALVWVLTVSRGVEVRRSVGARRVEEDQPVAIEIELVSRRALPCASVIDSLLPEPAHVGIGSRRAHVRIAARFARRGERVLPGARAVVSDPLGLVTCLTAAGPAAELLVLPRVAPVVAARADGDGDAVGTRRGRPAIAAEVDLDGLRPWREGTPASRIFWPALARGGDLLERRMRADSDTRPLVVLDARAAASPDDEDAAVRAAASLAVHLARAGGCAVLLPGERRPVSLDATLTGWPHLHARLAVADPRAAPALGGLPARRGAVFYVSARRVSAPVRALAHAPGGGRILVVPGTLDGRRAAFTVGGCSGHELTPHQGLRGGRAPARAGGSGA